MLQTETEGLTGQIKFDSQGFRSDFKLEIIELTTDGLLRKGSWNISDGFNFIKDVQEEPQYNHHKDLRNFTFVVMVSLVCLSTFFIQLHCYILILI